MLFNSTLYRSELVMYEKDSEANILWILDMHYMMLNFWTGGGGAKWPPEGFC